MNTAKRIAARAWEIGPTWADVLCMVAIGGVLVWFGLPSWAAVVVLALGYVVIFGTLAWLDLQNESFDRAAADAESDSGEAD